MAHGLYTQVSITLMEFLSFQISSASAILRPVSSSLLVGTSYLSLLATYLILPLLAADPPPERKTAKLFLLGQSCGLMYKLLDLCVSS